LCQRQVSRSPHSSYGSARSSIFIDLTRKKSASSPRKIHRFSNLSFFIRIVPARVYRFITSHVQIVLFSIIRRGNDRCTPQTRNILLAQGCVSVPTAGFTTHTHTYPRVYVDKCTYMYVTEDTAKGAVVRDSVKGLVA
jgi:hypothetical protein